MGLRGRAHAPVACGANAVGLARAAGARARGGGRYVGGGAEGPPARPSLADCKRPFSRPRPSRWAPAVPRGAGGKGSGTGWVCRRWREEAWGAATEPSPEGSGGGVTAAVSSSPRPAPAAASPPCGLTACEILPQREKPASLPLRMKRFRICSTK